jgi:hypothetical protein
MTSAEPPFLNNEIFIHLFHALCGICVRTGMSARGSTEVSANASPRLG